MKLERLTTNVRQRGGQLHDPTARPPLRNLDWTVFFRCPLDAPDYLKLPYNIHSLSSLLYKLTVQNNASALSFPFMVNVVFLASVRMFSLKFIIFKSHKNLIFQLITSLHKTHHYFATSIRS